MLLGTESGRGEPVPARHELHPLSDPAPLLLNAKPIGKAKPIKGGEIRIERDINPQRGSATARLVPSNGKWDCHSNLWILLDVANHGKQPVLVRGAIRNAVSPQGKGSHGAVEVPPSGRRTLPILLLRNIPKQEEDRLAKRFGDVRGIPGGHQNTHWRQVDAGALDVLNLEFFSEDERIDCSVSGLRAAADFNLPDSDGPNSRYVSPMDRFGQERLHDWPSKIRNEQDLHAARRKEGVWIKKHPPLANRTIYGGWKTGPRQKKTGHFHTAKVDKKWWLVDPEGYLFWSLGITGVGSSGGKTRTPGLGKLLHSLPDGELAVADFPFVKGELWNPYQTNLLRKYGPDWKVDNMEIAHVRLHAWGINTLGNWSDREVCLAQKTPYVTAINYPRPRLDNRAPRKGSNLPDVFHPEFREKTFQRMRKEIPSTASDPWCIGYFIDNELRFPNSGSPATQTLDAPDECHSRQEFIKILKKRHGNLAGLNTAWGTAFGSWTGLGTIENKKTTHAYWEDIRRFSEHYYDVYYGTCRDALKTAAPRKLYLGSRINHVKNHTALRICAKYADVVGINLYDYTPDTFRIPDGLDKPIIIGEFHFGTITEQGVWGAGLTTGMDLAHSADLFKSYVQAAVRNPMIVGAHWFQLQDQPLTGRSDGENYRIGFLNVADIPHQEMIEIARKTSESMYNLRNNSCRQ